MNKSGIRIWGGAITVVAILAAGGFIANNQFISGTSNTANRESGNTTIQAGSGSTISVNPLSSSTSPASPLIPSPSSSPVSIPSLSSTAPKSEKLEADCENFGAYVEDYTKLISVANKVEEPRARFHLYRGKSRSLVCKIIKNSGELNLMYALPDNSLLNRATLKVYVDGVLQKSIDISRGEVVRQKINIAGATGYKLDFSVPENTNTNDYVYGLSK